MPHSTVTPANAPTQSRSAVAAPVAAGTEAAGVPRARLETRLTGRLRAYRSAMPNCRRAPLKAIESQQLDALAF